MKDIALIDDDFINQHTHFPTLIAEIQNGFASSTIEVPPRHHHDFANPKEDIDSITPGTEDLRVYSVLIKVVEKASKENTSKAQLIGDIKELGDIAVKIAKKIPQFSSLL